MNRRSFFKSIVASGLLVAIASVFTGCNSSVEQITPKEAIEKHSNLVSVIDYIQIQYNKGLYVLEELNFKTKTEDKVSFDTKYTLPWYIGPQMNIGQNKYFITTYSAGNLLETGFGIGDKIDLMYRGNQYVTPARLNELGFSTIKELYSFVFNKVTSYNSAEAYILLDILERHGVLKVSELLNLDYLTVENDKFIRNEFRHYLGHENVLATSDKDRELLATEIPMDKWFAFVGTKQVHFLKEDYLIYSFTKLIVDAILEKAPKGQKINVF